MSKPWEESEKDMLRRWGADPVPQSGAGKFSKLDGVITSGYLSGVRIENKHTIKGSYSLKKELLEKSARNCLITGAGKFIVRVDFDGEAGIFIPEKLALQMKADLDTLYDKDSE